MDREFDCLVPDFPVININTTTTSKHVTEIEWKICVIKERARYIRIKLPHKRTHKQMIIELLKFVVVWLNTFHVNSGVSATFSPQTIMTGTTLDWKKHCKA